MTNANYGKLIAGLVAAWFVFALSASALNVFKTDPQAPPLAIGLSVVLPILAFVLWFAFSPGFRQFALSLSPRTLTIVQSWRIAGLAFVALYTFGLLPGFFALPAGWGDVALGVTAPLVALKLAEPGHRRSFIVWQLLGMTDLVLAVALGTTARLIDPQGVPTAPVTVLPLSLIPTFGVPLLFILHVICIAQARQWRENAVPRGYERVAVPAG